MLCSTVGTLLESVAPQPMVRFRVQLLVELISIVTALIDDSRSTRWKAHAVHRVQRRASVREGDWQGGREGS